MNNKEKIQHLECYIAVIIFLVGLILRVIYVFTYHFDTDEPQHLHVVWAWANGFLPYKDIFDNHTPLFHILCIPIIHIIGEHAYVLYFARLAMAPLFAIGMFCTYIIAKNLFSKRVAVWSVALVSIYPDFLLYSLEFRADILWMVLWLAGLTFILSRGQNIRQYFWAGLFFGLSLCTSMKTALLLFSLLIAVAISILSGRKYYRRFSLKQLFTRTVYLSFSFLIVPVIFIIYFAMKNALKQFFYCSVSHNILSNFASGGEHIGLFIFSVSLIIIYLINKIFIHKYRKFPLTIFRSILFSSVAVYIVSLYTIWPITTMQDFLPVFPLVGILITPAILNLIDLFKRKKVSKYYPVSFLSTLALIELIIIFFLGPRLSNETIPMINMIDETIKLTDKNNLVMDQKGETIFRQRPYYYILETITRERIKRGLIPDTIVENLISKKCYVTTNDISRFPQDARVFILENYISVGYMRVAGKFLEQFKTGHNVFQFDVRIPGYYKIIGEVGEAGGFLDDIPYKGAHYLEPGIHRFILKTNPQCLVLIWAQAVDRGFLPR